MSITKKNPPQTRDAHMSRALSDIYRDINDIVESVNSSLISVRDTVGGKPGDIRVIKVAEDKYRFEARAEEGWVRPGGTDVVIEEISTSTTTTDLANKVNEILTQLNNLTFRLVKKGE